MDSQHEQLNALSDIRRMMDRSSRFISLSGLSGVFAGIIALIGAYFAQQEIDSYLSRTEEAAHSSTNIEFTLIKIGLLVLIFAIAGGIFFTYRQSKKKGLPIWDKTAKNLLINLTIPLATGGLFIIAMLIAHPNTFGLIAPSCLVFYGLSLINASKYTYTDIRFLGICEIVLGLASIFNMGYGLYFWAFGFGVMHILYGVYMWLKYEKN